MTGKRIPARTLGRPMSRPFMGRAAMPPGGFTETRPAFMMTIVSAPADLVAAEATAPLYVSRASNAPAHRQTMLQRCKVTLA